MLGTETAEPFSISDGQRSKVPSAVNDCVDLDSALSGSQCAEVSLFRAPEALPALNSMHPFYAMLSNQELIVARMNVAVYGDDFVVTIEAGVNLPLIR